MRLIKQQNPSLQETEIIVSYPEITPRVTTLLHQLDSFICNVTGKKEGRTYPLALDNILYFESVEDSTFIYTAEDVFDCAARLYELENEFANTSCVRVSKSCILNTLHVESVRPLLSGRMEVLLSNNEKILVTRHYLPAFKSKFNLEGL